MQTGKFCKCKLLSNGKSGAELNCFLGFAVRVVTADGFGL